MRRAFQKFVCLTVCKNKLIKFLHKRLYLFSTAWPGKWNQASNLWGAVRKLNSACWNGSLTSLELPIGVLIIVIRFWTPNNNIFSTKLIRAAHCFRVHFFNSRNRSATCFLNKRNWFLNKYKFENLPLIDYLRGRGGTPPTQQQDLKTIEIRDDFKSYNLLRTMRWTFINQFQTELWRRLCFQI